MWRSFTYFAHLLGLVGLLSGVTVCCNSRDHLELSSNNGNRISAATTTQHITSDISSSPSSPPNNGDTSSDTSATSDESEQEEDDSTEAFPDVEDMDILCHGYKPRPLKQELPEAVIFGTRKGGTRALLEFLNMNSKIRRAKSETHFYDKHFDKGHDWYKSQMPLLSDGQIAMEKTPGYFHTADVPQRLWATKNDTKLLLIVRDPVKRLISDYNQFFHNQADKGLEYPSIHTFLFDKDGEINEKYPPLQRSIYHKHMRIWMKYFPLEQMYIVDGDRFIKEPWVDVQQIQKFLHLPEEVGRQNFYFNQTKGFYCGREIVENVNVEWSCSRNKCLSKSKGRAPPKIDVAILKRLYAYMDRHNELFFNLINRFDFNWTLPADLSSSNSSSSSSDNVNT